jgi:hypothetical protein
MPASELSDSVLVAASESFDTQEISRSVGAKALSATVPLTGGERAIAPAGRTRCDASTARDCEGVTGAGAGPAGPRRITPAATKAPATNTPPIKNQRAGPVMRQVGPGVWNFKDHRDKPYIMAFAPDLFVFTDSRDGAGSTFALSWRLRDPGASRANRRNLVWIELRWC